MRAKETYDAVIVGARCAGSPLAIKLARDGWRVLLLDRRPPPEDTLSTHFVFPNTVARLAELDALERMQARHELHMLLYRIRILDYEIAGAFTPIAGFDRGLGPRRPVLDQALLDSARDAGAKTRFGERVVDLLGSGTPEEPVHGLVLESGERIGARWVFGADGRASTVAGRLGLGKQRPMAGEFSILFAYWRGLPPTEYMHLEAHEDRALNWWRCEDDIHILVVSGPADFSHGNEAMRERRYLEALETFPATLEPSWMDGSTRVSEIRVAPETMLRGYFRQASGPGWALVGDAGHFKHPATAQGISDAIEQAIYIGEALRGSDESLGGYERWRDERAAEHYEWSFDFGRFPRPEVAGPLFAGLERDPEAAQDLRDALARRVLPRSGVFTRERVSRWFAAEGVPQAAG